MIDLATLEGMDTEDKVKRMIASIGKASWKDFRNAVQASQSSLPEWSSATAYLRGQILAHCGDARRP